MAYRIPTFNLTCNVWHGGRAVTLPPDSTPQCQLRASGKQSSGQTLHAVYTFLPEILFPAHTDIRDTFNVGGPDTIECPAGSGRYYTVGDVDDVAKGFANEYRQAVVYKSNLWPTPIP